jgi:hypothetical protein
VSETGVGASSTVQEGVLHDQDGGLIAGGAPRGQKELEPLVLFARDQPFTTVFLALGFGYLVGKLL